MTEPLKQSPRSRVATAEAPAWPDPPRWSPWFLGVVSIVGVALGGISTWVHHRLSAGAGYTSFCNVNDTINCDRVVLSSHGTLLGVPVSAWAIAFYAVLLGFALRAAGPRSAARDRARADAFGWAVAGSLFSAYLATISIVVLRTLCLLCAGLYVVSAVALGAAWVQASPLREAAKRMAERWRAVLRHPFLATTAAATAASVLVLSSLLGAQTNKMTREQVFRSNPQFYDWYTSQPIVEAQVDGGYSQGPENAPIQLVEFSDFECPHCAQAYVTLKDLLPRYANQVRFTYHHFPLSSDCNSAMKQRGHEHACHAAIAAECAAQAGHFAPFANLLFANQGQLEDVSLHAYAKQAGADVAAFDRCFTSPPAPDRVAADIAAAQKLGVRSTPTFFLNNRKIEGNMTYEQWLLAFAVELDKG
jgi:protein-disulfide isomerase